MTSSDEADHEQIIQRTKHTKGPSILDARATTQYEIASELFRVVVEHDLSADAQAFMGALLRAFYGREPYHKLVVRPANEGAKIQFAAKVERWHEALEMADKIDIAVASGKKLESEVAEAEAAYSISRREVFRRLAEIRLQRISWLEAMEFEPNDPVFHWYIPKGFQVDHDGKLVATEAVPLG